MPFPLDERMRTASVPFRCPPPAALKGAFARDRIGRRHFRGDEVSLGPGGRRGETAAPQLVSAVISVPLFRDGRQKPLVQMVGVAGFEPATPSSRTRCATRLRYTPPAGRGSSMAMCRPARARRHLRGGSSNVGIIRVPTWLKAAPSCGYVRGHKGRPRPDGASPSGKAGDFDSPMRRFESSRPSQAPDQTRAIRARQGALVHIRPM